MKEQTTLQLNQSAQSAISVWLNSENSMFSDIIEDKVSNLQVMLLGHACLAFSVLMCSTTFSLVGTLIALLWFAVSLHLCKKGGIK